MHTACAVAAIIICMAQGGGKDLRKHESTDFTHDRNNRPLEPYLFLRIMVSQSEGQRLLKPK